MQLSMQHFFSDKSLVFQYIPLYRHYKVTSTFTQTDQSLRYCPKVRISPLRDLNVTHPQKSVFDEHKCII